MLLHTHVCFDVGADVRLHLRVYAVRLRIINVNAGPCTLYLRSMLAPTFVWLM
jgi:hypothetical protein